MADKRISALDELITVDDNDVLAIVDNSAIPLETKKITAQNLVKNDSDVSANTTHRGRIDNPHAVTQTQVGLGNVDNTSDVDKPVSTAQALADTAVADFSVQRNNHTGTQLASTISDFFSAVRSTLLTGISFATSTAVLASDTILEGIGKLQAQINSLNFSKVIFTDYIPGVTSGPSTTATTPGTAPVLAEMTKTFTPAAADNDIDVFFSGTFGENVSGKDETVHIGIFIDGTLQAETQRSQTVKTVSDSDKIASMSTKWSGTLSAVPHTIDLRFWINGDVGAQAVGINARRALLIKETDE